MLHRVLKIQTLPGVLEAVVGQTPNPHRAIADHKHTGRLA